MNQGVTSGAYEPATNILHLWYERPVVLDDERAINAFFAEVEDKWVRRCPQKPYLLVNFRNVRITPKVTSAYAKAIERFRPFVLRTFRYGVEGDLTGVTVAIGNMEIASEANIFPDEASAREAIRRLRDKG